MRFAILVFAACLAVAACKNSSAPANSGSTAAAVPTDSIIGFKGAERAAIRPVNADTTDYIYQHYTVRVGNKKDQPGQTITIFPTDNTGATWAVPLPEAAYFQGMLRDHILVDAGTGPDGRELQIYDLKRHGVAYQTGYCDTVQIIGSTKVWFWKTVADEEVEKKPDCPKQAEWQSQGLSVGYGQRCIFDVSNRMLTKKSEYKCYAKQ